MQPQPDAGGCWLPATGMLVCCRSSPRSVLLGPFAVEEVIYSMYDCMIFSATRLRVESLQIIVYRQMERKQDTKNGICMQIVTIYVHVFFNKPELFHVLRFLYCPQPASMIMLGVAVAGVEDRFLSTATFCRMDLL